MVLTLLATLFAPLHYAVLLGVVFQPSALAALTNIKGFLADKPDLTITINRSNLEQTMMGAKTLEAQIKDGAAKVEGDVGILKMLASTMVDFDPRFQIMPGTKAGEAQAANADPYEAVPCQAIAE